MKAYVVLLRGINVGGKSVVIMKELVSLLEANGFEKVKTYIQSGNIVLLSEQDPEAKISALLNSEFNISPEIITLSKSEFERSVSNNPYKNFEGKAVYFYFCKEVPKLNITKLTSLVTATESYELIGNVFYLHAPDGVGRSKLVANIEACLGVAATGRNLNTVSKLDGLVKNI